jgi:hypothetical protein
MITQQFSAREGREASHATNSNLLTPTLSSCKNEFSKLT